jgi:hypothetical protein
MAARNLPKMEVGDMSIQKCSVVRSAGFDAIQSPLLPERLKDWRDSREIFAKDDGF